MLYLVGFRKVDLNEDYGFNIEDPIYRYVCDIGYLSEISPMDEMDLLKYFKDYKTFLQTLDNIENDYNTYNISIDDDKYLEYSIDDILHDLDVIPINSILNVLNSRIISYIQKITNTILFYKKDIKIISYFVTKYKDIKDIKILSKHDDLSFKIIDNKYNIFSESCKINKNVDWINYI